MPGLAAQDGVHIHYEVAGAGPTILLLHGMSADGQMNWEWTGIAPAFRKAGFRTVAVDQRGHGQSDKPHEPERYHDDLFARDVTSVLDHLGVENCLLMGYSMGAYVSLRAVPGEARVHALVLGGIGGNAPKKWDRENGALALEADELSDAHAGEARAIREYADATGADRLALAAIQRGRTGEPFELGAIMIPTLVIVGEDDELAGDAKELANALADAAFVRVPGDHASALIEPTFIAALVEFATRLSGT